MKTPQSRSLHLHTMESLFADLISARPVGVGESDEPFLFNSEAARSVLQWYYANPKKWTGRVMETDVESIVDCTLTTPGLMSEATINSSQVDSRYILISVQAHQFGGLHHPGNASGKPKDFEFNFGPGVTLFEGFNGCGKTSLLNAIIWVLTGEVLRPQRAPEEALKEFSCEIDGMSSHRLSPVMPLPDISVEKPTQTEIPVDTWVKLVFEDQNKKKFDVMRKLKRNNRGVLSDEIIGLDALGLDPIGVRVGTSMPGMLPFIQIGSESKLGKAVSALTGMAPLVNLAEHAQRAKKKIDGELTKERKREIDDQDTAYNRSHNDLLEIFKANPRIEFSKNIPLASADTTIEATLREAIEHFEALKAMGLNDATQVLGETFNAEDAKQRMDLEKFIQPAMAALGNLSTLPSTARLAGLRKLTAEEIQRTRTRIEDILAEADELVKIAADPSRAGRIRLYTRVASWIKEHPTLAIDEDTCAVCGHDITAAVDPKTGRNVKAHLQDAAFANADFLGQTFATWAQSVLRELSHELPSALVQELKIDLPDHPGRLIRAALIDELFDKEPFQNTLGLLRAMFEPVCDAAIAKFPAIQITSLRKLGGGQAELSNLSVALERINRAIAFSSWRNDNRTNLGSFMQVIVGQVKDTVPESLLGRLSRLQDIVTGIEPVTKAITLCERMTSDLAKRRLKETRLGMYAVASSALNECMKVGILAQTQVEQLQQKLHKNAVTWRDRIYLSAFPTTNLGLVASKMSGDGELQLMVGDSSMAAPAQHVSNASALRASLVGFFLAYWEHILKVRGGLKLLLLDDPQELLDGDNRERLADSIKNLVKLDAQLIITTHDSRFATAVARRAQSEKIILNHQYVHPATKARGTLFTSPSITEVHKIHELYVKNKDEASLAQNYASECRLFIEGRVGDIFDDAAFPTASTLNFAPTLSDHLGRLRGLMKGSSNELFQSRVLSDFCNHVALSQGSVALALLNKAHHSAKATIRPSEVSAVLQNLEDLCRHAERLHQEFRLYRRREPLVVKDVGVLLPLKLNEIPSFNVLIQPSLAAFVRDASVGETQETESEELTSDWFKQKAFYLLRSSSIGFAGPASSVSIVEAEPSQSEDRSLVIARRGTDVYARRVLRPANSEIIALAAETPDPRRRPQALVAHENEFVLHKIVGILFDFPGNSPASKSEAVQIDGTEALRKVRSAYKIKEDSAVPLALPGQIVLGGVQISLDDFEAHRESYVALHLDDGQSIFKRVGDKLPAPLNHLRRFDSIGSLGVAEILSTGKPQSGLRTITKAVQILGVLYQQ